MVIDSLSDVQRLVLADSSSEVADRSFLLVADTAAHIVVVEETAELQIVVAEDTLALQAFLQIVAEVDTLELRIVVAADTLEPLAFLEIAVVVADNQIEADTQVEEDILG